MEPLKPETDALVEQFLKGLAALETGSDRIRQSNKCEVCQDIGFLQSLGGLIRCQCRRDAIIQEKLQEIPKRFRNSTFANFTPTDDNQRAALATIAGDITKSLYIHGDYGRGKTHLATAQYSQLVHAERPCMFMGVAELIQSLRRAELDSEYYCLVRYKVRYAERFHLFVDDIDKFKNTDFKFECLFDVFDTVYKRELGLTVTSNYSLRDLSELNLLHPAIVRRLDDICQEIEL